MKNANVGRKASVTKTGEVEISPYNVTVSYEDIMDKLIKTTLGVKEYDNKIKFYGKVTITIEELVVDEDVVNTFGTIPDKVVEPVELV